MYIGLNISYLRRLNNLKQKTLAVKLNVVQSQIGKYEKGESLPPLDKIMLLCEIFGVDYNTIIGVDIEKEGLGVPAEPARNEETLKALQEVASLLRAQLKMYERIIVQEMPDKARELGLID